MKYLLEPSRSALPTHGPRGRFPTRLRAAHALVALSLTACAGGDDGGSDDVIDTMNVESPASAGDPTQPGRSGERTRYIVVFREQVASPASEASQLARGHGGQVEYTYTSALKGFAVTLPDAAGTAFLEAIARNPNVERVEVDQPVFPSQTVQTQSNATWGLDRIDQRDLPLSSTYSFPNRGAGVTAYILDTGILASHVDFTGRVAAGYTAIADGRGATDCNGHGTHVAGTVGGATWGIAKGVSLVPVRVLPCTGPGTLSAVLAGLDWVNANARRPAVVNMSLGGGASSTIDNAVANTVSKGITVVVAAGNEAVDACTQSPARAPSAITVGATTSGDARASYSNFGTCLDVFAPGSSIRSAWYTGTTVTATSSGTSMAAPHVAGLAALMLAAAPASTPAQLDQRLKSTATLGKVTGAGTGSPNRLVHTSAVAATTVP